MTSNIQKKTSTPPDAKEIAFKTEKGNTIYIPKQENIFKKAAIENTSLRTPLNEEYKFFE